MLVYCLCQHQSMLFERFLFVIARHTVPRANNIQFHLISFDFIILLFSNIENDQKWITKMSKTTKRANSWREKSKKQPNQVYPRNAEKIKRWLSFYSLIVIYHEHCSHSEHFSCLLSFRRLWLMQTLPKNYLK